MAGRIRDEDIVTVRERARLDLIVGEYVTLRSAGGGSMKGLCPFHDERSPSFHVTPARGMYYCFGCGEGGDVLTFLQRIDSLSFTEAVERLADKVGVQLRYEESSGGGPQRPNREQRTRLVEASRAAAEFYAEQLGSAEAVPGRTFLDQRGFDRDAAAAFGVGYAPKGGETLRRHLLQRGFRDDELIAAGLTAQGQGSPYDRFRGRLVWPIQDLFGDVVGFGARRLFDDDRIEAKYLNTPETTLYKKSQVLYGVAMAKKEIGRTQQAVVVEGYTDVMACHLAGVTTAVATCGTAFGEDHTRILRRLLRDQDEFRGQVIFTFDGDEAGQRAAMRAFEGDQRFVGQTYVAVEPTGLDPCDLRLQQGDAAVRELVARHRPLFAFAIATMVAGFDLANPEGRTKALDATIGLVARIRDRALRDEYARRLAGWVGAPDEMEVVRRVRGAGSAQASAPAGRSTGRGTDRSAGDGGPPAAAPVDPHAGVDPQTLSLERDVLRLAVQRPALAGPAFDEIDDEAYRSPLHRRLRTQIADAGGCASQAGGPVWVDRLRAGSSEPADPDVARLVAELSVEPLPTVDDDAVARYAQSVVLRLHEVWVSRALVTVKATLQRTDPSVDVDGYNRVFGELLALEKRRRDLRERGLGGV